MILALVCSTAASASAEQAIRNVPRITIDELKALMAQDAVLVLALKGGWEEWLQRGEKIEK